MVGSHRGSLPRWFFMKRSGGRLKRRIGVCAEGAKPVIKPRQAFVGPGLVVGSRWKETRSGLALFLGAIGFLDGGLGLLERREWNPYLEGTLRIQIEKMVLAANCFVRDALLVEELAEFSVDARVITTPERAQGIIGGPWGLA